MRFWAKLGLLLGLTTVAVLLALLGYETVVRNLSLLGWGFALLPLAFMPNLGLAALCWHLLFTQGQAPRLAVTLIAKWIATSVNTLLPFAGIGGDVVRLRVLMRAGVSGINAGASVVVDKTIDAVALVLWGLIGIVFLVTTQANGMLVGAALTASALLTLGIAGFVLVQHAGAFSFLANRLRKTKRAKAWSDALDSAGEFDAKIRAVYRQTAKVGASILLRLLGRVTSTVEIWLIIGFMGQSITIWDALMIKSLTAALRGAAFFVPSGWGLQEGGFIMLGGLIGFPADFMLAVSLATRGREVVVSIPGLFVWQHIEGKSLWKRRTAGNDR